MIAGHLLALPFDDSFAIRIWIDLDGCRAGLIILLEPSIGLFGEFIDGNARNGDVFWVEITVAVRPCLFEPVSQRPVAEA
jgi:hypothetical protein